MNEEWVYSGSTVGLQWVYSGSTVAVALQWLKDEQKTNKRRIYTEDKAKKGYRNIGY
ncbi:hypothetical protein [Capnocytophaga sp. oral taxon 323]|uniref:hypothetical protein n=1 Tax=Capnocytophaga sp. oral taxon 323 TaxID=1705617 RepID=UPI00155DA327|nr:hypothetical protein [Capnocytophaga sp. oral taxon 323]